MILTVQQAAPVKFRAFLSYLLQFRSKPFVEKPAGRITVRSVKVTVENLFL